MAKSRQTVKGARPHPKATSKSQDEEPEQPPGPQQPLSFSNISKALGLALPLLTLAALNSPVSQATLAPVYGAIPSSVNHAEAITATVLVGYVWRVYLVGSRDFSIVPYLALWCFWLPAVQMFFFRYSGRLGPVVGPILTGFLSCHTVIIPSAYAAAQAIETLKLQDQLGSVAGYALPAIILDLAFFRPVEGLFAHWLPRLSAWSRFFSPVQLQLLIATLYSLLSPVKPWWLFSLAPPAVFHACLANPHLDSSLNMGILNRDLQPHNWTLLDRAWSNTGYISVIESSDMHYRVLRCDHSLLGGEWLLTEDRRIREGWQVNEPIYAVFEMLEAVRLIETEPVVLDADAQALVVGLGIGTAPKALMAHGINTTTIELDPAVHNFAVQYFGLPNETHNAVLQDAVSWVSESAQHGESRYDYILHDVFTGGAEPLALFTDDFLGKLRSLLTPNGVVALNYAGDLSLDLTRLVLNTIDSVFDGQCKIFRDAPAPVSGDSNADSEDFLNMVVFCRNSPGPITFRKPTRADLLGSKSRGQYLLPREEYEISFPSRQQSGAEVQKSVLRKGEERQWKKQQEESAIRHWHIMRRVMPDIVWEMW